MVRKLVFLFCVTLVASAAGLAQAGGEPGDFSLRLINSGTELGVGAWDDGAGEDLGVQSPPVFGFDLGSVELFPGFNVWTGGDPGHNSPANDSELHAGNGTVLPVGQKLQHRLVPFGIPGNGTQSNLWYWDGMTLDMGNPVFNPVGLGENLTLSISRNDTPGSGSATSSAVSGGNTTSGLLSWGAREAGLALHSPHASTTIAQVGGVLPDQGVYMVGAIFSMDGYLDSAFTPILYLAGFDEEVHDAALDWAIDGYSEFTPVPEPSTFALAGMAGVLGLGYWRRKRGTASTAPALAA